MVDSVTSAASQLRDGALYRVLCDNREVTSPITPMQMKDLLASLRETGLANRVRKAAIVVNSEASYGMMRLFGARAEPLGIEVSPFWTLNEALDFLGPDDQER